jgi:hypothetical protein
LNHPKNSSCIVFRNAASIEYPDAEPMTASMPQRGQDAVSPPTQAVMSEGANVRLQ